MSMRDKRDKNIFWVELRLSILFRLAPPTVRLEGTGYLSASFLINFILQYLGVRGQQTVPMRLMDIKEDMKPETFLKSVHTIACQKGMWQLSCCIGIQEVFSQKACTCYIELVSYDKGHILKSLIEIILQRCSQNIRKTNITPSQYIISWVHLFTRMELGSSKLMLAKQLITLQMHTVMRY